MTLSPLSWSVPAFGVLALMLAYWLRFDTLPNFFPL